MAIPGARSAGDPSPAGEGHMGPQDLDERLERFFGWLCSETDFGDWEPRIQAEVRAALEAVLGPQDEGQNSVTAR